MIVSFQERGSDNSHKLKSKCAKAFGEIQKYVKGVVLPKDYLITYYSCCKLFVMWVTSQSS
jgi:hypothetical protein